MTNRVEISSPPSITMEIPSHELSVEIRKEPQTSDIVSSAALPVLVQMAAAAPPSLQREEGEQRFIKPKPPSKRRQPTHSISSRRTAPHAISSSSSTTSTPSSAAAPQGEPSAEKKEIIPSSIPEKKDHRFKSSSITSSTSSSAAAPQAVVSFEQKEVIPSSTQEKKDTAPKEQKRGMMSEALMYGKVAFAACVAPDAFQLVENVLEQPNISSACVASVRTLSHANIATRIGGAVFLAPSICRRILFGTPWEQAATLAAGATALYCTGGAVVPTLIFAEGAGLVAFGADGTKNAIASTAKKVTTACKNYFSSIASGLRPSVRQTFQNFYARIRGEREAQRTIDRQQRIEEARQATKQDQDMQKPNDSPAPQP